LVAELGWNGRSTFTGAISVASRLSLFLADLKRRKVSRVAVVYVVVGLGILGAAEVILDPLGLDALRPYIVILVILGFPIALVLAWAYELKPEEPEAAEEAPSPAFDPRGTEKRKSIVVLPFVNMSDDSESEYFSDGMTEEIINALAQLKDLRVAARTSSFAFKGSSPDLGEVGAKLRVATVLEGSVRKAGNRLRITAQLIDVSSGYHLWSERYDRELDDVFAIQDEIARAIADKLRGTLGAGLEELLVRPSTENLEAYDLYLKGRFCVNLIGKGPLKGLEYFQEALARDPDYALVYAGIAEAYSWLGNTGMLRPKEAMPMAREAAMRALELDETLAEAYFQLAWLAWNYDFEWSNAEKHFLRALELNGDLPQIHSFFGFFLASMGRFEESLSELHQGIELDPLAQNAHLWLVQVLAFLGRPSDAIERLRIALELDPESWHANFTAGMAYRLDSRHQEAVEALEKALALPGRQTWSLMELALSSLATGDRVRAEAIYEELATRSANEYVSHVSLANVTAALGRIDEAFEWLDRAYEERDALLTWVSVAPHYDPLRDDPRFDALLERMGFDA
jgi:TolB-like protein/Tfp pilus assembly protein PilF